MLRRKFKEDLKEGIIEEIENLELDENLDILSDIATDFNGTLEELNNELSKTHNDLIKIEPILSGFHHNSSHLIRTLRTIRYVDVTNECDIAETTGYNSETTGYNSETTGYNSETTGYNSETTGYNSETTGYNSGSKNNHNITEIELTNTIIPYTKDELNSELTWLIHEQKEIAEQIRVFINAKYSENWRQGLVTEHARLLETLDNYGRKYWKLSEEIIVHLDALVSYVTRQLNNYDDKVSGTHYYRSVGDVINKIEQFQYDIEYYRDTLSTVKDDISKPFDDIAEYLDLILDELRHVQLTGNTETIAEIIIYTLKPYTTYNQLFINLKDFMDSFESYLEDTFYRYQYDYIDPPIDVSNVTFGVRRSYARFWDILIDLDHLRFMTRDRQKLQQYNISDLFKGESIIE